MVELPTVVPRIDDRDWSKLTLGERIRQIEIEGYVLIPDMLSPDQIERIKAQVETLKTMGMDYSERQRTASQIMFMGGEVTELAAHPATMSFLNTLLGDDLICWRGDYARSEPGHPGMAIHTDAGGGYRAARDGARPLLPERPHAQTLAVPRDPILAPEPPRRGQLLHAVPRAPRRDDGHGKGGIGGLHQPPGIPRQLPEQERQRPGDGRLRLPARLVRASDRDASVGPGQGGRAAGARKGAIPRPEHPLRRCLPRQPAARNGPRLPRHKPRPLEAGLGPAFSGTASRHWAAAPRIRRTLLLG